MSSVVLVNGASGTSKSFYGYQTVKEETRRQQGTESWAGVEVLLVILAFPWNSQEHTAALLDMPIQWTRE